MLLDEIIARHSVPRELLSDRGQNFLSKVVQAICDFYQICKCNTTAFHPTCNGLTEKANATIMQSLAQYTSANQKDWDVSLPALLFAFRIAPSSTTGESPFYLLYGREPMLPMEIPLKLPTKMPNSVLSYRSQLVQNLELTHRITKEQAQLAQMKMNENFDRHSKPYPYYVGHRVWIYTPKTKVGLSKKLLHCWDGPYRLVEKLSPVTFKLRTSDNRLLPCAVHVNRCKPYYDPETRPFDTPVDLPQESPLPLTQRDFPPDSFEPSSIQARPPVSEDGPLYLIEQVLKRRTRKGVEECMVKRQGYSSKHNSWIPTFDIVDTNTADTTTPVPTVSAFSGSNPTMPFKRPINNILPYFIFTFCFLTYLGPLTAAPSLGPLYDCSRLYDQAYLTLPKPQNCSHSMQSMHASFQFYMANVYQPFAPRSPLSLFH